MDAEEKQIMERLRDQFNDGLVVKKTVIKAKNIWNKYNPSSPVEYCMCTAVRRHVYAKQFIEWYESLD
jgi:hypothetical protein